MYIKIKYLIIALGLAIILGCNQKLEYDIENYFKLINKAELLICEDKYQEALEKYNTAFTKIRKPFGKDLYNAAICAQYEGMQSLRNKYIQIIVNNSNELHQLQSKFIGTIVSPEDWNQIITNQQIDFNEKLREEFVEIRDRDQLFRPMYDTHDDTINANRKINLDRILEVTDSTGFPSQIELGYASYLVGQNHHIVLHHTAQRRSRDKTVIDLEPLLFNAVHDGRLDPETAILYMSYQNDIEKGRFEVYSIWQKKHPLLPDSLNNKIWIPNLSEEQINSANQIRNKWLANSLEDIAKKANYKSNSTTPFIFTSVKKSIGNISTRFNEEEALEQYKLGTSFMKEYKSVE